MTHANLLNRAETLLDERRGRLLQLKRTIAIPGMWDEEIAAIDSWKQDKKELEAHETGCQMKSPAQMLFEAYVAGFIGEELPNLSWGHLEKAIQNRWATVAETLRRGAEQGVGE